MMDNILFFSWIALMGLGLLAITKGFKLDLNNWEYLKKLDNTDLLAFIVAMLILMYVISPIAAIAYALIWLGRQVGKGLHYCFYHADDWLRDRVETKMEKDASDELKYTLTKGQRQEIGLAP